MKKPPLIWSRCYYPIPDTPAISACCACLSEDTPVYFLQHEWTGREWMTSQHLVSLVVKHIGLNFRRKTTPQHIPWRGERVALNQKNSDLLTQIRTNLKLQLVLSLPLFQPVISQWLWRPFKPSVIRCQHGLGWQLSFHMRQQSSKNNFFPPTFLYHTANAC